MNTPAWWHREIAVGDSGPDAGMVRRLLSAPGGDTFDESDAIVVRGLQHAAGLPVTGVVDHDTAVVLGEPADRHLEPTWFTRTLRVGSRGSDVARVRTLLQLRPGEDFDHEASDAVRRLQSAHGLPLTGKVGHAEALLLGE